MRNTEHLPWFPALLKTAEGEVLAEGSACVSSETKDVTFQSDFVPLYPVGTPLEIVRLSEAREIHRFFGKVYLSDKTLLRLVSVTDRTPPDGEQLYCSGLAFSGTLTVMGESEQTPRRRFGRKPSKAQAAPAELLVPIVSLSENRLIFLYDSARPFDRGQRFSLSANMPLLLPQTTIEVEQAFLFGVNASYLCRFLDLTAAEKDVLRYFLLEYSLRQSAEPATGGAPSSL